MYSLYSLNDPITDEVRYIGYTSKTIEERLASHWRCRKIKKRNYKLNWFSELEKKGLKPIIKLITTAETIEKTLELEVYYISLYDNLTNSTSGGEVSKTYLPEVIAKMKANRRDTSGKNNHMYGIKNPELAERNKNKVWTEEEREKLRIKALERNKDPEYKKQHVFNQKSRIEIVAIKDGIVSDIYPSKKRMCVDLGLDSKSVNSVLKGECKQHKGYTFKVINNDKN